MIINPTWEACFVADTHAMKSSRVWEAYFAADTQNVKTGRYNKGTLYSKMFGRGCPVFWVYTEKMSCEILKLLQITHKKMNMGL